MRGFAQSIVETVRHPLLILDGDLRVRKANAAFYRRFQASGEETEGHLVYELGGGQWDIPRLRALLEEVARDGGSFKDVEVRHDFPHVGVKVMVLDAHLVVHDDGTPMLLLAIEDATDKTQALDALYNLNRELDDRVSELSSSSRGYPPLATPRFSEWPWKISSATSGSSPRRGRPRPWVILTPSKEEKDLLASYDFGANSYVRKPVDFARFADAIQQLQMYRLVLNESPSK